MDFYPREMSAISNILTPYWALSLQGFGYIVQGIDCIRQRIDIAVRTRQGSDPLRPLFGTLIYQKIDDPILKFIPFAKNEMLRAIGLYVPEVSVTKINHTIIGISQIEFEIVFTVTDSDVLQHLVYNVNNGVITTITAKSLTLQGIFPANTNGYRYALSMLLNGAAPGPIPPVSGFGSIEELYEWIETNLSYLGKWVILPDQLILYVKDASYKTGSITIGLINVTKIVKLIPALLNGKRWQLLIEPTGTIDSIIMADPTFFTIDQILQWVSNNWANYGTWTTEIVAGEFSNDFDQSFGVGANSLVLTTSDYSNLAITINLV